MSISEKPVTFGVIVGSRGFFNPTLAAEGRQKLLSLLQEKGFQTVITDEKAAPNGAIETLARATAASSR